MSTPPAGAGTRTSGGSGGNTGGGSGGSGGGSGGGGNLPVPAPSNPPAPTGGGSGGGNGGGSGGGGNLPVPKPSNPPATPTPPGQPVPTTPAPGGGQPSAPPDPTAWTPPTNSGVVEVDPQQLWDAAQRMTSLRDDFIAKVQGYAGDLAGTSNMAGEDYIGVYTAGLYDPVAQDVMNALGDLMNSVGGAIEGLILSANTYAAADHASTPGSGSPPSVPVPSYGAENFPRPAPATLYGYQDVQSWGGNNPVVTALAMPLTDPIGALTAWFPKGHQDLLITAADAWRGIDAEVSAFAQGLNGILDSLTVDSSVTSTPRGGRWSGLLTSNQVQAWQGGMRKFCNKIWGAKPWGTGGLPDHPLGLAATGAEKLAKLCDEQRHAIDAARSALERQTAGTVLATIVGALLAEETFGISLLLAELIDEADIAAAINTLIDTYYRPLEQIELTWDLETFRTLLERAVAAAPTIQYMEAQADSIGTRSLHDFGYPGMQARPKPGASKYSTKQYSGWGDPTSMPKYPIDLAGQEGTGKSHVLDRHVGLTDQQLLDRASTMDMSDPQNGSSGFSDIGSAQTLVQGNMNDPANQQLIAAWLAKQPRPTPASQDQLTINQTLPPGSPSTGRVVVDQNGTNQVVDGNGVKTVLKYNQNLNPPYYVGTSFPTKV